MRQNRWSRLRWWAAPALITAFIAPLAVVLSGSSSPAQVHTGFFLWPGAPIYADDPDGVACLFTSSACESAAERAARPPAPAFTSRSGKGKYGETIPEIVCYRALFALVDMHDGRRGWASVEYVLAGTLELVHIGEPGGSDPDIAPECNAFTWN